MRALLDIAGQISQIQAMNRSDRLCRILNRVYPIAGT
jgi:hypothetical protein